MNHKINLKAIYGFDTLYLHQEFTTGAEATQFVKDYNFNNGKSVHVPNSSGSCKNYKCESPCCKWEAKIGRRTPNKSTLYVVTFLHDLHDENCDVSVKISQRQLELLQEFQDAVMAAPRSKIKKVLMQSSGLDNLTVNVGMNTIYRAKDNVLKKNFEDYGARRQSGAEYSDIKRRKKYRKPKRDKTEEMIARARPYSCSICKRNDHNRSTCEERIEIDFGDNIPVCNEQDEKKNENDKNLLIESQSDDDIDVLDSQIDLKAVHGFRKLYIHQEFGSGSKATKFLKDYSFNKGKSMYVATGSGCFKSYKCESDACEWEVRVSRKTPKQSSIHRVTFINDVHNEHCSVKAKVSQRQLELLQGFQSAVLANPLSKMHRILMQSDELDQVMANVGLNTLYRAKENVLKKNIGDYDLRRPVVTASLGRRRRRRNARIREEEEAGGVAGKDRKPYTCSICKGDDHNRSTCQEYLAKQSFDENVNNISIIPEFVLSESSIVIENDLDEMQEGENI